MKMLMNTSLMAVMVCVVMVSSVKGVTPYTTGIDPSVPYSIAEYASSNGGSISSTQMAMETFTFDGQPRGDVWAIVLSDIGGKLYFNGFGFSGSGEYSTWFAFITYGESSNPLVQASKIIFILNDGVDYQGNGDVVFLIDGGQLIVGLGGDVVLGQWNASIEGKEFGDISSIRFLTPSGNNTLASLELFSVRPGPYNMEDFAEFASFWLSGCGVINGDCHGFDFNYDGIANFVDFSYIANDWAPSVPMVPASIPEGSIAISSIVIEGVGDGQ